MNGYIIYFFGNNQTKTTAFITFYKTAKKGVFMLTLPIAIIDSMFSAFLSFIACFLVLNFYIDKPYSIIFSVIISIPILIIAYQKITKNRKASLLNKQTQKNIENTACSLCFLEKNQLVSLFEKALTSQGYGVEVKNNGLYLQKQKSVIFPIFSFDGITKTDVVRVFNCIKKGETAYILGKEISNEVAQFIQRFDNRVVFIGQEKVYTFLKKCDSLPKEKLPIKTKKFDIKEFILPFITRSNSKKFLLFGTLFIIMSYFAPIKLYYVIIGCAFILLSLILRLFLPNKTDK